MGTRGFGSVIRVAVASASALCCPVVISDESWPCIWGADLGCRLRDSSTEQPPAVQMQMDLIPLTSHGDMCSLHTAGEETQDRRGILKDISGL